MFRAELASLHRENAIERAKRRGGKGSQGGKGSGAMTQGNIANQSSKLTWALFRVGLSAIDCVDGYQTATLG